MLPEKGKALDNAEPVEATFRFFRPSREGDGTVVHSYTIQLTAAKISGIRTWFPNTMDPASTMYPHREEVSIIFPSATITFDETGITHTVTLTR